MEKGKQRVYLLCTVLLMAGFYLAYRLYTIQVAANRDWALKAVNQRSDGLALYRQRGAILDCHGQPLTGRDHRVYLAVLPPLLTAEERKVLTPLLAAHHVKMDGVLPLTIADPSAELLRLVAERPMMGVTFCTIPLRYGSHPVAHHLLGYVHPTTGEGIAGLEAMYDEVLASDRRVKLAVMTDAHQCPIPGLGWRYQEETRRRPARNLVLTLDFALQRKVETLLDEAGVTKGAVVLMEVGTGKIRALASRPVFNPYRPQLSLNDPDRSLWNRALMAFPPGGLWRLIITAAALERGMFDPDQVFFEDAGTGSGLMTLTQAFAYGTPSIFQMMVSILGTESILTMADACGLGAVAVGLPGEESGILPDKSAPGDSRVVVSGEEKIAVTPVQIAAVLQMVAGNGAYYPPTVVEGLQGEDGAWTPLVSEVGTGCPVLAATTVAALRKMLEATVLYGTGQKAQIGQEAAGIDGVVLTGYRGAQPVYHSWFAGYAPAHAPRLVGVVFLEDDPGGAERAAALFAALMTSCL